MKKFKVLITEYYFYEGIVEAKDEEEATQKGFEYDPADWLNTGGDYEVSHVEEIKE